MERREFLRQGMMAGVAATVGPRMGGSFGVWGSEHQRPMNVVLILGDDIGREVLRCFGGESYETPNLDRLAAEGVRFPVCYATPVCCPSRVELMTGRYSFRNYTQWRGLDPKETTFAQLLGKAGYATAIAGKWQFEGWEQEPPGIVRAGFDEYSSVDNRAVLAMSDEGEGNVYWNPPVRQNGREIRDTGRYTPEMHTDFLVDFMERNGERPFLAYYSMNLLHRPFMPTPESEGMGQKPAPPEGHWWGNEGSADFFADMVRYADRMVGKLLNAIDRLGLRENTVVIFTADNGTDNVCEAAGMRLRYRGREVEGGKYFVSERGVNMPLIVRWPGSPLTGKECDALADFTDVLPTVCEACGVPIPSEVELDGRSILPLVQGKAGNPRPWVYSWGGFIKTSQRFKDPAAYANEHIHVLRDKRWKYYSDGRVYDLERDPFEERPIEWGENSAADGARERLKSELRKLRDSGDVLW